MKLHVLASVSLVLALCFPGPSAAKTPPAKPSTSSKSTGHTSSSDKSRSSNAGKPSSRSSKSGSATHSATSGSQQGKAGQPVTTKMSQASAMQAMHNHQALMFHAKFHELAMLMALQHHHHHFHHYWNWGYWPLGGYGLAGNVVGVPSGDSLMVTNGAGQARRVRLFGVAAPSSGQFAVESQQRLSRLQGKFVHVHSMGSELDGSMIAKVHHGGSYVNQDQIATGMAFNLLDHGLDVALANAEQSAQEQGKGLWAEGGFAFAE